MLTAILFIGHGTRRQHGVDEFLTFVHKVKQELHDHVVCTHAFLELQPPTIPEAIEQLYKAGITYVVCIPLFLFSAGHMKEDIPHELAVAKQRCPNISLHLSDPFGTDDGIYAALSDRVWALPGELNIDTQVIVLLGRGNKDQVAQATFESVARRLQRQWRHASVQVAYLDGTGISLEDSLVKLAKFDVHRVIILPFLWFSGWLTDTLPDRVAKAIQGTGLKTQIAPHIGLHERAIHAVANRVKEELSIEKPTTR